MNIFQKLTHSFDMIRQSIGQDIETQALALLLHTMTHDPNPLLVKELQDLAKCSHSSASRNLRVLGSSDDHPRGGECAGLLQAVIDPKDKRRKLVTLSAKGRRLKAQLSTMIGEGF